MASTATGAVRDALLAADPTVPVFPVGSVPDGQAAPYWVVSLVTASAALKGDARTLADGSSVQADYWGADPPERVWKGYRDAGADSARVTFDDGGRARVAVDFWAEIPPDPDEVDLGLRHLSVSFTVTDLRTP